jgi:hypothetical protein
MNPLKTATMITITMLIMILIFLTHSMPTDELIKPLTRHKRWTFNTWRLHGPQHTSHAPIPLTTGMILYAINIRIYIFILK